MEIAIVILVGILAIGAVAYPFFRGGVDASRDVDPLPAAATPGASAAAGPDVEAEISRYREAVRAHTICPRCQQANPPGSRFCYECGSKLNTSESR